jgi:hypothetical protein
MSKTVSENTKNYIEKLNIINKKHIISYLLNLENIDNNYQYINCICCGTKTIFLAQFHKASFYDFVCARCNCLDIDIDDLQYTKKIINQINCLYKDELYKFYKKI